MLFEVLTVFIVVNPDKGESRVKKCNEGVVQCFPQRNLFKICFRLFTILFTVSTPVNCH